MTFSAWFAWLTRLPWSRKWFVLLVLTRPMIDGFYFLSLVSPLLSPLYIVGVLTPLLIGAAFVLRWLPKTRAVWQDYVFGALAAIVGINCIFVLKAEVSLASAEIILKITMPFFIYFFARRFIRSGDDLMGLVMAFAFSSIVPFCLIFYETLIAPIGPTATARGMSRLNGLYADVVSYAIYSTQAFLCLSYLFLARTRFSTRKLGKATRDIAIGFVMCLACLLAIKHAASWAVAVALLTLVVMSSGQRGGAALVCALSILVGATYFSMGDRIRSETTEIYRTDMEVISGKTHVDRGLHGRVTIWKKYTGYWLEFPIFAKLLGSPMSLDKHVRVMLLGGVHSDYLRMLFVGGIFGLLLYLGFLAANFVTSFKAANPERFLIRGMLVLYGLYSVTIVPSVYAPSIYLGMSIFAYAALVEEVSKQRSFA